MHDDPIIEEIRKVRDQLARAVDYDVRALGRKLQKAQKAGKRKVVSLAPKSGVDEMPVQGKGKTKNAK